MSHSPDKTHLSLAEVAASFERELERFEQLASTLVQQGVTSEKTLQRARVGLESCAECERVLAAKLGAFVEAMQAFQERQQRCMASVLESAHLIEARHKARQVLLERVAELGRRAGDVTVPMEKLGQDSADATRLLGSMQDIGAELDAVIAEAGVVVGAAHGDDWPDIARDVEALKQRLQAARNKLLLAQRRVAAGAPS